MNVFEEVQNQLSSKVRIRSLVKHMHTEDIERIIGRLNSVLEEKLLAKIKEEENQNKKKQSINNIKKIMDDHGVSINDLSGVLPSKKRRNIQHHIFEYQNKMGEKLEWQGTTIGRLPKDFQDYLDRTGKVRVDCIVRN